MENTEVVENDKVDLESKEERNQKEAKYIVNVGYWVIGQESGGQFSVEPKVHQLLFNTKREADDKIKQLQISKMFTSPTLVGNVSFAIISLELVSIEKYVNWQKQQQELAKEEQESQNQSENNIGEINEPRSESESGE